MANLARTKTIMMALFVAITMGGCGKKDAPVSPAAQESGTRHSHAVAESVADAEGPVGTSIPIPVKQADEFNAFVPHKRPAKEIIVNCRQLAHAPTIDGIADESFWDQIAPVETLDNSSQRPIEIRSFHDGRSIYFLVSYPDSAPSESHKSWIWDKKEEVYKPGNDREDMFVLKWLMSGESLSFDSDWVTPHTADIWFWKARRTNPVGFFDDKSHHVTLQESESAVAIKSDKYGTIYLVRPGDAGKSAYEERMFFDYQGDCLRKYYPRTPQGSRADVAGKGFWKDGRWTIEIRRKLDTGHDDDIRLEVGKQYVFAASLYEMSASPVEDYWFQPLYKSGNAFDRLILKVQ